LKEFEEFDKENNSRKNTKNYKNKSYEEDRYEDENNAKAPKEDHFEAKIDLNKNEAYEELEESNQNEEDNYGEFLNEDGKYHQEIN